MTHWTDTILQPFNPCKEAMDWALTQPDLATAWAACTCGDWMLWLWGRHCGGPMDDRRRPLVLAACECARTVLPIFEARRPNDNRPHAALELAERWGRGAPVTRDDLRAATSATSADAGDTAYAAAYAAWAAYAAAYAAWAAYAAAWAAAAAAADAADTADARTATLAQCADIVRKHMPTPAFIDAAGGAQ